MNAGRNFWDSALSLTPAAQRWHSVPEILSPYDVCRCELTLFIYAFNHAETILGTLETVCEAMEVVDKTYELIIIDDHSTDRTAELVQGFMAEFPKLPVVLRMNKHHKGMAQNYVDAAFMGCGRYFRMVLADDAEAVETMVDVLHAVGDADVVVPYYVFSHHGVSPTQHLRSFSTKFLNMLVGERVNHYNSCAVHLRYNVMRWPPNTRGGAFQADLLCRMLDAGFTLKQVPCRAEPVRISGRHERFRDFWSYVHVIIDVVYRRVRGDRAVEPYTEG